MMGYTDLHSHFVWGVDDGAPTRAAMEKMLDEAYADGIQALVSTPHFYPGMRPFDWAQYEARLAEAQRHAYLMGYPLELYRGAEVMHTPMLEAYVRDHALPTLADSGAVLIEFAPDVSFEAMERAVRLLERAGYLPVIAHMERYRCLARGRNAWRLREAHDLRYQINAHTITEEKGFFLDRRVYRWLDEMLVDFVASDAHDSHARRFRMKAAYRKLIREFDQGYVERLVGLRQDETLFPAGAPGPA